jgi:hypothetical protein
MSAACKAVGCTARRGGSGFLCRDHWYGLPIPLRRDINAKWRAYRAHDGDDARPLFIDYVAACDEAIRLTADREGALADFTPDAPRLRAISEARSRAR